MTEYLVGTGGWGYFRVPSKLPLKAYSEIFNFVEVNYTFYEYPEDRLVERWRRTVPKSFTFSVRCNQDLTHRIELKPAEEAYYVFDKMIACCRRLEAPFLVLETPSNYVLNQRKANNAREFFSSISMKRPRLVWEIRAPLTSQVINLLRDFDILHCVDLSIEKPSFESDTVYSRLFGKGAHNIYQFTDDELLEIDQRVESINPRVVALSYHGARMNTDAARYVQYKKAGNFLPVTSFTGVDSAKAILCEDAIFPMSKSELIVDQGWKVIDLNKDRRIHLSDMLSKLPEKTYNNVDEIIQALEAIV